MKRTLDRPDVPNALRFKVQLTTRWVDEDNQGVLNNAVHLTLLEEARLAYFRELDLMDGAHFPFVLGQCNLWFQRPGRGGALVTVELATVHLGESSFVQAYRVSGPDGDVWLEAEAVLVAWDNSRRTKRTMTTHFRETVRAFEGLP